MSMCTANTNANLTYQSGVKLRPKEKKTKRIQECDKPRSNQNKNGESVAGLPITHWITQTNTHSHAGTHNNMHAVHYHILTIKFKSATKISLAVKRKGLPSSFPRRNYHPLVQVSRGGRVCTGNGRRGCAYCARTARRR